jgi:hypothetical protein
MQIRKAVIADIPTIQQIAEETWRPTYSHILTEEQTIYMLDLMYRADILSQQIQGNIHFFIVEEDRAAIGYFAIEPQGDKLAKLHIVRRLGHHRQLARCDHHLGIFRLLPVGVFIGGVGGRFGGAGLFGQRIGGDF